PDRRVRAGEPGAAARGDQRGRGDHPADRGPAELLGQAGLSMTAPVADPLTRPGGSGASRPGRRADGGATSPLQRRRAKMFWPFLLPALVLYTAFMVGPTLASFWISLHSWDGITPMTWRGLTNFHLLLADPVFHTALVNTLVINRKSTRLNSSHVSISY